MLITTLVVSFLVCSMLEVRWSLAGVVSGLQAQAQVVLEPATRTLLQPNCNLPPTNSKPRTKRPMWQSQSRAPDDGHSNAWNMLSL